MSHKTKKGYMLFCILVLMITAQSAHLIYLRVTYYPFVPFCGEYDSKHDNNIYGPYKPEFLNEVYAYFERSNIPVKRDQDTVYIPMLYGMSLTEFGEWEILPLGDEEARINRTYRMVRNMTDDLYGPDAWKRYNHDKQLDIWSCTFLKSLIQVTVVK